MDANEFEAVRFNAEESKRILKNVLGCLEGSDCGGNFGCDWEKKEGPRMDANEFEAVRFNADKWESAARLDR